jgi:hypothetical protein
MNESTKCRYRALARFGPPLNLRPGDLVFLTAASAERHVTSGALELAIDPVFVGPPMCEFLKAMLDRIGAP